MRGRSPALALAIGLLIGSAIVSVGSPVRANGCGVAFQGTTYSLSSAADFTNLQHCDPNWTYKLVADVDLAGVTIVPRTDFTGSFDGQGHTLSNVSVSGTGLFNVATAGASFTNVHIRNATVSAGTSNQHGGVLVGTANGPVTITNSSFSGAVIGSSTGDGAAGGFIGAAVRTTVAVDVSISASSFTGSVSGGGGGHSYAGGFVGNAGAGAVSISNATATADVVGGSGDYAWAGGFVGVADRGNVSVTRSLLMGSATGGTGVYAWAGGFFGVLHNLVPSASVTESYVVGTVNGGTGNYAWAGGFIGSSEATSLSVSRSLFSGSVNGGSGTFASASGMIARSDSTDVSRQTTVSDSFVRATLTGSTGIYSWATGIISDQHGPLVITDSYFEGTLLAGSGTYARGVGLARSRPFSQAQRSYCVLSCGEGPGVTVSATSLVDTARNSGWNFASTWCTSQGHNDGFPVLRSLNFGPYAAWSSCVVASQQAGGTPFFTLKIDTNGGKCTGVASQSVLYFVGHRYLPASTECARQGHVFVGWARSSNQDTVVAFPLLVDPSDGVRRFFLAENADLVAVWKMSGNDSGVDSEIEDLSGTAPGAFIGGPDRPTREGGGVVDGYYIPPGTRFWPWMLAR